MFQANMRTRREYFRILIAVLLYIGPSLAERLGCKDEKGNNVDWFINYKLPKIKDEPKGSDLNKGISYAYILAPGSSKWTLSTKSVLSSSMMEKTLDTYYKTKEDLTYLFYNDDPPDEKSKSAAGHLKGTLVFDGKTGFWLIHSIPNFPDEKKFEYPESAETYGQTAMCITFKTSELNKIANQLLFDNPNIYAYELTDKVEEQLDDKARTLFSDKPEFIKKEPFTRIADLKSLGGMKFKSFAKDNQFLKDLYSDIIAPELETSLIVETWRKGAGGVMDAVCKKDFTVVDISAINMTVDEGKKKKKIVFRYTEDHSKWAISDEEENNFICIADLNRMPSQKKRGGGALCFESKPVVAAFDSIIEENDECSDGGKKRKNKRKN